MNRRLKIVLKLALGLAIGANLLTITCQSQDASSGIAIEKLTPQMAIETLGPLINRVSWTDAAGVG